MVFHLLPLVRSQNIFGIMWALSVAVFIFAVGFCSAQEHASVQPLDQILNVRWGLDNQDAARKFHIWHSSHRSNLLPVLEGDDDAAYWAACFLSNPYYLEKNPPEQTLALLLYTAIIERNFYSASAPDDAGAHALSQQIRARVMRCLLAHQMRVTDIAVHDGAWLDKFSRQLAGTLPALSEEEMSVLQRYTSIY